ncbi:hypothetical protein [Streptomyces rubrogriseus]|uniref:hypothetical protein n=1 Tax=Streptomyces rubrogriseus TaxID=194673 RepID=UPI003818E5C2
MLVYPCGITLSGRPCGISPASSQLEQAMAPRPDRAYVIFDAVLPIDRITVDQPYGLRKKKHHGMNGAARLAPTSQPRSRQGLQPRRTCHGHPHVLALPAEAPSQHHPDHGRRPSSHRPRTRNPIKMETALWLDGAQ